MLNEKKSKTFHELGINWIGLELNNTCNIRCTFCPITFSELQRPKNKRLLNKEIALKVLQEIREDGTLQHVVLNNYGEPFLCSYFEDILKFCKENGIRMRFATNGTQFNDKNNKLLRKYPPEELVISIQYFFRKHYKKVKGTNIDYDSWMNQIANFLKIHMEENLNINVQLAIASNSHNTIKNKLLGLRLGDTNIPYPDKKFYKALNLFIEKFCVDRMKINYKSENIEKIAYSIYTKYYSINSKISFEIKSFFDSINYYKFKESNIVDCCLHHLIVNSQGNVLICCSDYISGTLLGNIKKKTIKEILLDNYDLFLNKNNKKAELEICRTCMGERTYRGLLFRQFRNFTYYLR